MYKCPDSKCIANKAFAVNCVEIAQIRGIITLDLHFADAKAIHMLFMCLDRYGGYDASKTIAKSSSRSVKVLNKKYERQNANNSANTVPLHVPL